MTAADAEESTSSAEPGTGQAAGLRPAAARVAPALTVTLGLLAGIAPFGTDMYLPSFPAMVREFSATNAAVQLSLTAFLIGAGLGQLVFGPLSDRVGRFPPLAAGAAVFVVASAGTALAPDIPVLIAARLVQGLAGSAGMVIGRAVISDLVTGRAAARAFSLMMTVTGIAPIVAPLAGSALADPIGWRGILWIVTGIGAVALIAVLAVVRETNPRHRRDRERSRPQAAGQHGTGRQLLSRAYVGHALAFGFGFATMMAYISASPFVYQDMMGFSTLGNGLMFGTNAVALVLSSTLAARLARRFPPRNVARTGLLINLGAIAVLAGLALGHAPAISLAVPLLVAVGSLGLVLGPTTALAQAAVPRARGLASAFIGLLQFGLAGLVTPFVTIAGDKTAVPLAIIMLGATLIANAAFAAARPRHRAGDAAHPAAGGTG